MKALIYIGEGIPDNGYVKEGFQNDALTSVFNWLIYKMQWFDWLVYLKTNLSQYV